MQDSKRTRLADLGAVVAAGGGASHIWLLCCAAHKRHAAAACHWLFWDAIHFGLATGLCNNTWGRQSVYAAFLLAPCQFKHAYLSRFSDELLTLL
jgi:hypothetical protein